MNKIISDESTEKTKKVYDAIKNSQRNAVAASLEEEASLQAVIKIVDNASERAEHARLLYAGPEPSTIACKSGCHWCCAQYVEVTPAEAIRIADHINNDCPEQTKKQHISKLQKLHEVTQGKSQAQRGKLNQYCAFLNYGQCTIYEVRPLACRKLTSYDASECKKAAKTGFTQSRGVKADKVRNLVYHATSTGMKEGLHGHFPNAADVYLEFTSAVLRALEVPNAFEQWAAGVDIFKIESDASESIS